MDKGRFKEGAKAALPIVLGYLPVGMAFGILARKGGLNPFEVALLTKGTIPRKIKLGLEYIPVAILSAIVFPILFFDGEGGLGIQPQLLVSAVPVFIFAWKVKSLWGSVILGMLIFWGLGFLM